MDYNQIIEKARLEGSKGNWSEAIKYYEKALEQEISEGDLLDLAICYLLDGNSKKAYDIIEFVIKSSDSYLSYYYLGIYNEILKYYDDALKCYLKSVEKGNTISECFFKIGHLYDELLDEDKQDVEKAIKYYKKSIEINPEHLNAYQNLSALYLDCENNEEGLKYAQIAYDIDSKDTICCYNLAVAYDRLNNSSLVEKYYLEATKCDNVYPYAYYNLGIYYTKNKKYDQGINCYLKCLKLINNDYHVWYNLGCTYALKKDYKNALECFHASNILDKRTIEYIYKDEELKEFVKDNDLSNI